MQDKILLFSIVVTPFSSSISTLYLCVYMHSVYACIHIPLLNQIGRYQKERSCSLSLVPNEFWWGFPLPGDTTAFIHFDWWLSVTFKHIYRLKNVLPFCKKSCCFCDFWLELVLCSIAWRLGSAWFSLDKEFELLANVGYLIVEYYGCVFCCLYWTS